MPTTEFVSVDRAARLVDGCANERTSNSAARPTDSANTSIARKKKTLMARMETRITLSGCRRPAFSTRTENNLPLPINHTPCCWLYRPQAKSSGVAIDRPSSFLSIIPTLIIRGVAASRLVFIPASKNEPLVSKVRRSRAVYIHYTVF